MNIKDYHQDALDTRERLIADLQKHQKIIQELEILIHRTNGKLELLERMSTEEAETEQSE